MNIPLFERDGFIICFEAEPEEDIDMRKHFVGELKWTKAEYSKIKNFAWFSAKVSAWKDGEELGTAYLGACCYETSKEFYTVYKDDYFAQMVDDAVEEAKSQKATA